MRNAGGAGRIAMLLCAQTPLHTSVCKAINSRCPWSRVPVMGCVRVEFGRGWGLGFFSNSSRRHLNKRTAGSLARWHLATKGWTEPEFPLPPSLPPWLTAGAGGKLCGERYLAATARAADLGLVLRPERASRCRNTARKPEQKVLHPQVAAARGEPVGNRGL